MHRLLVGAVVAATALTLALPAQAETTSTVATVSVEPCSFSGTASVTYQQVNGRATSGVWRVSDRADCSAPERALAVKGQLLRNGRLVKGFAPGDACTAERGGFRCSHVAGKGSHKVAKGIAGTWVLRLTMTVRGPDAARLSQRAGCVFVARTSTATCSQDSPPLRIR